MGRPGKYYASWGWRQFGERWQREMDPDDDVAQLDLGAKREVLKTLVHLSKKRIEHELASGLINRAWRP